MNGSSPRIRCRSEIELPELSYTVAVTFPDRSIADAWLVWLRGGPIAAALAGGAPSAEIIEMDGEPLSFEIRYHFPSREAFALYERDHAPRLRAEGLKLFPTEKGIRYRRTTGWLIDAIH